MTEKKEHGTIIAGIAASEHLDSSGERIIISGVDISSLTKDGVFNFEHHSDEASRIVGKIIKAKKIFSAEDAETENELYFWDKVKMPFIYVIGELFDHVGHSAAQDVAAMLRYDKTLDVDKTKALINFSIEGSRLGKEGNNVTKCIARKVAITIHPCNKMAYAEELENSEEFMSNFKKTEEFEIEILKAQTKYYPSLKSPTGKLGQESKARSYKKIGFTSGEHKAGTSIEPKRVFTPQEAPNKLGVGDRIVYTNKKGQKAKTGSQLYQEPSTFNEGVKDRKQNWKKTSKNTEEMNLDLKKKNKKKSKKNFYTSNMRKAITASCGVGAPSSKVQGDALQKEKILKHLAEDSWKDYLYKDELVEFICSKIPDINKNEALAIAKTYSYLERLKIEKKLEEM